jgi:hypothetical protein
VKETIEPALERKMFKFTGDGWPKIVQSINRLTVTRKWEVGEDVCAVSGWFSLLFCLSGEMSGKARISVPW